MRISVSCSRAALVSFRASSSSRSVVHRPSFGSGWTSRSYARDVSPDRSILRTVFRDTRRSRAICLIVLPLTKCSRRIRPIVSTVSIPPPPASNQSEQRIRPNWRGSILDADNPLQGVKIARRITLLGAVRQESERVERLEQAIRDAVPEWSLAEVVTALQAMRGIDLVAAVTVLAEIGDLSRFQNPRELMGYLGLVPSESSTGDTVNRGGITKAGNGRARRILVEAAWSYRYPPRVSREKQMKVAAAPRAVREIAWKAQMRLCGRFRSLTRKGKRPTVVATAIAREPAAFIWAINREVVGSHATANQ